MRSLVTLLCLLCIGISLGQNLPSRVVRATTATERSAAADQDRSATIPDVVITSTRLYAIPRIIPVDILNPHYRKRTEAAIILQRVRVTEHYTVLTLVHVGSHTRGDGMYMMRDTELLTNTDHRLPLLRVAGIAMEPEVTRFTGNPRPIEFKLYFAPLPAGTTWVDLIENRWGRNAFNLDRIEVHRPAR